MYRKSMVLLSLFGVCLMGGAAGAAQIVVKINFQTAAAEVPAGYLADSGLAFGDRGNGYSYGWSRDISADSRDRANANADQRYDTLVHLQKGDAAIWEIVLPNGEYTLVWAAGDPTAVDQTNSFNVEGVQVPDPDTQDNFDDFTLTVKVTDGRLTLQPGTGAANSKICFIDITQILPETTAKDPVPADDATDVVRDIVLSWTPAASAGSHNVYFGTSFDDVNNATTSDGLGVLVGEGQAEATYEPASVLAYAQTYYWRIDEVNAADGVVSKGETWSFTAETFAYPIQNVTATASSSQVSMGPENSVGGVGLDADDLHATEPKTMWLSAGELPNWIQYEFDNVYELHELWVWNSNQLIEMMVGFGAKSVTIECSVDGSTWTEVAAGTEFAQATGSDAYSHNTTVDLSGAMAKYVRLTINATWSGLPQAGLSEVRFFYVPVRAFEPVPADAATGVLLEAPLSWRPGRKAGSHTVYFGSDLNAVTDGTAASQTVADASFSPADLSLDTTYYWRVDEANEAETPSLYEGDVWSFTTQECLVVEDFESYDDDENRIYDAWVDGLTTEASGSQVGYDESPFAEQTIIHGGKQSMPLAYNNTSFAFSEATWTFETAQNWTADGVKSLTLYFRGAAENTGTANLYVKIGGAKVAYSGEADDIAKGVWIAWNIDLSKVSGNLSKVAGLTVGVEGSGAQGIVYIDDIGLYPTVTSSTQAPVITAVVRANGQTGTRTDASPITSFDGATTPLFIVGGLQDGATIFSDRPYPWANTPSELAGADYVLMFNTDKNAGETDVTYTVTLDRAATVYVTCDDRIVDQQTSVDKIVAAFAPAGKFQNTGLKLYIRENATTDRPMSVFAADLAAGTYVFGAQDSGNNFYTIAAIGK